MAHIAFRALAVTVPATCSAADTVGDLVYVTSPATAGIMACARVDIGNAVKMPVVGILTAKSSPTTCRVALSGIVRWTGLTPGARYFAGMDGRPTSTRPAAGVAGTFIQAIGIALDETRLALAPSLFMTKVIP